MLSIQHADLKRSIIWVVGNTGNAEADEVRVRLIERGYNNRAMSSLREPSILWAEATNMRLLFSMSLPSLTADFTMADCTATSDNSRRSSVCHFFS